MLYLLSELEGWESSGQIEPERALRLRSTYEGRRDNLRRALSGVEDEDLSRQAATTRGEAQRPEPQTPLPPESRPRIFPSPPVKPVPSTPTPAPPLAHPRRQRTLFERLADPQTLRLLLYTGAGMLVVGVIIWLRDLLYLKLQEPLVQAGLLAFATALFIASGWYITLRTRQRWTGRALTLAGSLLFPVNFWFLVRSGLIENHGRGWLVCLFCALLYALTAAVLSERLYIYLSCAAAVATLWALILRDAPRAFGLYSLALTVSALVFLHLSRLFPDGAKNVEHEDDREKNPPSLKPGGLSRELWGAPLVRSALVCIAFSLLLYLPLRFTGGAASFGEAVFQLLSSSYDAGIALLLSSASVYIFWFAGRYASPFWRRAFYTLSALLFFLTVWVACDGFRLSSRATTLVLAVCTFLMTLAARAARERNASAPLYYASLMVGLILAIASFAILIGGPATLAASASLALVGASLAALCAPQLQGSRFSQAALAHLAALYFSMSYFAALRTLIPESETLFTALGALWPLLLYGAAQLMLKMERETQLSNPFTRIADGLALLFLLWGGLLSLVIHIFSGGASRSSSVAALTGVLVYGAAGLLSRRSLYNAALGTLAAVIMMATVLDALKASGIWPASWPVAAGTIIFIFIFERAVARLLRSTEESEKIYLHTLLRTIRVLLDLSVTVSAGLWLLIAFTRLEAGGFAASVVLLFALLYWVERVAAAKSAWVVRITCAHMAGFLLALLIGLRVSVEWLNLLFVLTIFPTLFVLSRYARANTWLSAPLSESAAAALLLSLLAALIQSSPHLQVGDERLLAPSLTVGACALLSFAASIFSRGRESLRYFRTGLWTAIVSLMLASLRAGFDPVEDVEIYSTPIAVLLLVIAYLSLRRAWAEYDTDAGLLLWLGSLLLCAPLLVRALEYRLLLDTAALWRDMSVLMSSLALIFYGIVGRMRAPVLVGAAALITELTALTLTSVDWLQVPLKYYLITVGALLLIIFGTLEYKREQFLLMRQRLRERRDRAREQFNGWR